MSLPVFEDFVLTFHNDERQKEAVNLSRPASDSFVFHYTDSEDMMYGHHHFWYDQHSSEILSNNTGVPTCVIKRKREKEGKDFTLWYVLQQSEEGFLVISLVQGETRIEYDYSELRRREGWKFLIKKSLKKSFYELNKAYFGYLLATPAYRLLDATGEVEVMKMT